MSPVAMSVIEILPEAFPFKETLTLLYPTKEIVTKAESSLILREKNPSASLSVPLTVPSWTTATPINGSDVCLSKTIPLK